MAKFIVVDETRCLACRQCEISCALAHSEADTLVEAVVGGMGLQSRVHVEPGEPFGMPMQCRHCEDGPCMTICPTGAIARSCDDAPVLIDLQRCIGCRYCLLACPFGVISMSREGKAAVKCDRCVERIEAGEAPACVEACPTGAMTFQEIDEWLADRRRRAADYLREAMAREQHAE